MASAKGLAVVRRSYGVICRFGLDSLEDVLIKYINGVVSSLGNAE